MTDALGEPAIVPPGGRPAAPLAVIVAVDRDLGIGKHGAIPWRVPADIRHFKRVTRATRTEGARNAVVMGRKTWESIPERFRPLRGRVNIVLSRDPGLHLPDDVLVADSLERALALVDARADIERVFAIGGGQLYAVALRHPRCRDVYITRVDSAFECDTRFPDEPLEAHHVLHRHIARGVDDDLPYVIEHWRRRADTC